MKTQPMTGAERDARDESFRQALRDVKPFAGIDTLEATALEYRRAWARFHQELRGLFNETGYSL